MRANSRVQELIVVSIVVVAISGILFWRFLPLPSGGLNFFTEPAYMLAKFGRLAAPCAHLRRVSVGTLPGIP